MRLVLPRTYCFVNNICRSISNFNYPLSDNDLKMYHNINNIDDCMFLQRHINTVHKLCWHNSKNINLNETTVASIASKTNRVARSQFINDPTIMLDCKLRFHFHVDYIFSQGFMKVRFDLFHHFFFSTIENLTILYNVLV
jgi:hypothetical protein